MYLYGPEIQHVPSYVLKNGVSYRILHDPVLGSIRYVINPTTRQTVQEIEYDEYGNMIKNTNPEFQPLTFAGGLWDSDTKFIRFGARDYDPTIGRWTTKDPIGFAGGDMNLYGYLGQNPMSYNDPSGLKFNEDKFVDCFLNGAGPNALGTSELIVLGCFRAGPAMPQCLAALGIIQGSTLAVIAGACAHHANEPEPNVPPPPPHNPKKQCSSQNACCGQ